MTNTIRTFVILFVAVALLGGCGFKLRGDQPLPVGIDKVNLVSAKQYSPLQRALKKRFRIYQIPMVEAKSLDMSDDAVNIVLLPDSLDRRLLSLFPTGQVAEYELVFSVRYQVVFPQQEPQLVEFEVTREYQDDPDEVLAKSRELDLVLGELREQAADRIIRLLASQQVTGTPIREVN